MVLEIINRTRALSIHFNLSLCVNGGGAGGGQARRHPVPPGPAHQAHQGLDIILLLGIIVILQFVH